MENFSFTKSDSFASQGDAQSSVDIKPPSPRAQSSSRKKRVKTFSPNAKKASNTNADNLPEIDDGNLKVPKKKILGELFKGPEKSGSTKTLMFWARNPVSAQSSPTAPGIGPFSTEQIDEKTIGRRRISSNVIQAVDEELFSHPDMMNPRQQLAVTIRNWCMIPNNHERIIKEGGVHALVALTSIDDPLIRECCASALYDLSCNRENLKSLLSLGASAGIITLSMQQRSSKVARLCAMALCNLAMQKDGESIMAKDGALIALMILLSTKGQKLLPICVQALYNLTCIDDHYKDLERILKALINIPVTSFDHYPYLSKALVNCSRFPWIRLRMIEDGVLGVIVAMIQTIPNRENKLEFAFTILSCIRFLTESPGCRGELLVRGVVDVLYQLLPYSSSDQRNQRLVCKSMHNLLTGTKLNSGVFDQSVKLIISITAGSSDLVSLQYCAACLYIFSMDSVRSSSRLASKVVDVLPKLLDCVDTPITQFYSIATTGQLMFVSDGSNDSAKFEDLIIRLSKIGLTIQDKPTVQVLAITFAKICNDQRYLAVLERNHLIEALLDVLLSLINREDTTPAMWESCGVAISRIALKANLSSSVDTFLQQSSAVNILEIRRQIPDVIFQMLDSTNINVLISAIGSARILGHKGYFREAFSSDMFYTKVASIVARHRSEQILLRMCCAVLAVFSYETTSKRGLSEDTVMNVLFSITKSDDVLIKKLIATTLCNMTINAELCDKLVNRGVVGVLDTLSGSTSEMIQELCAKCICNLTCSIALHKKIIQQKILSIILMISLVRSVGILSKRLCATSLLNLITSENMSALKDAGVIRVFATLSSVNDQVTRNLCARGFLLFTTTSERCEELIARRVVVQALYAMVKDKSVKSRILVGLAVCNLLSFQTSQKAAISAGALSVLKVISTMAYNDLKEAAARAIISIAQVPSLHVYLTLQPVVPILTMMIQQTDDSTLDYALHAMACMSQYDIFRGVLLDKGAGAVLVNAAIAGKIKSTNSMTEFCRCMCFITYVRGRGENLIKQSNLIYGLHAVIMSGLCSTSAASMIGIILRNLSFEDGCGKLLIDQEALRLFATLMMKFPSIITSVSTSALLALYNLSKDKSLHLELVKQGFTSMIYQIVFPAFAPNESPVKKDSTSKSIPQLSMASSPPPVQLSTDDVLYISKAIESVSNTHDCCVSLVAGGVVEVIHSLYYGLTETSRLAVAKTLANLSAIAACRQQLVELEAGPLLMKLARSTNKDTQQQCSIAMTFLSTIAVVQSGVVESMLVLALKGSVNDSLADTIRDAIIKSNTERRPASLQDSNLAGVEITTFSPKSLASSREPFNESLAGSQASERFTFDPPRKHVFVKRVISEFKQNAPTVTYVPTATNRNPSVEDDDQNIAESIIVDGVLNKNYLRMENASLFGDYSAAAYTMIAFHVPTESGGTADEFDIQLSLPAISQDVDDTLVPPDRTAEMIKVPSQTEPLPKDFTVHTEASVNKFESFHIDRFKTEVIHEETAEIVDVNVNPVKPQTPANPANVGHLSRQQSKSHPPKSPTSIKRDPPAPAVMRMNSTSKLNGKRGTGLLRQLSTTSRSFLMNEYGTSSFLGDGEGEGDVHRDDSSIATSEHSLGSSVGMLDRSNSTLSTHRKINAHKHHISKE